MSGPGIFGETPHLVRVLIRILAFQFEVHEDPFFKLVLRIPRLRCWDHESKFQLFGVYHSSQVLLSQNHQGQYHNCFYAIKQYLN